MSIQNTDCVLHQRAVAFLLLALYTERNEKPSLHTGLEPIVKQYYSNAHTIDSTHVYCIFTLCNECSDICINGLVDEYMRNELAPHPTLLSTIAFYADGRIWISEDDVSSAT